MAERLISWNVNGLRAVLKKDPGFEEIFRTVDADVFAIQETKLQEGQVQLELPGYFQTWSYAERKGYAGTAVFSRKKPIQEIHQIGAPEADNEGRVCALEFDKYWFVDVYTPNAQPGLKRLETRLAWDASYRDFLSDLAKDKPVVTCGDFNVAHEEIDLANPDTNHENPGFSDAERESFGRLLDAGFVDTFRSQHPDLAGAYSWWSYRMRARERGIGWRIDYFLVSEQLMPKVTTTAILDTVFGSDHCPVELELEL
ncbi:MAG: exodeoxyribonuclease III [Tractidigestivibacter sp.]|jgi:exodeoxyribonuclease-3|uniref:exodeoxyribonuclease III n=1 Tax=Tractidigestivibacter sp. TaxID=2847320 RepID=UPI003D8A0501